MAGLKNTATLPPRAAVSDRQPLGSLAGGHVKADQRQQLLSHADRFHQQAMHSAEQGDYEASARLILQGLDCERRAGGLGPQVLQLIKPRG